MLDFPDFPAQFYVMESNNSLGQKDCSRECPKMFLIW